jgi:Tfp pilus assembly protein PilN
MIQARWLQSLSRADFLKSVGLYVTRHYVILARLSKDLTRLSLVEQQVREIEDSGDATTRRHSLSQAIRSLLPHFNPARDPCYLCFSLDQAVSCQAFFPQAVAENLSQVLDYEVGRLLPFRRDEMYYDYLVAGKKGDKLSVMLFAVPKRTVDEVLDALVVFGIKPRGVDTSATALANYLLFCNGERPEPALFLSAHNGCCEMIGLDRYTDGWKRQRSEMLFAYSLPATGWARLLSRELVRDWQLENAKFFTLGSDGEMFSSFMGELGPVTDLATQGRGKLSGEFQVGNDMLIPALGAALRGLREARFSVNLLPQPVRQVERRGLSRLNLFLVVLLLLALVAWGGSSPLKDEIRLRQLQAENRKFAPAVEALRQEDEELARANKELTLLLSLRNQRGEILQVLDELSRIVPDTAYLSNLRYRDGSVELQGNAENTSNLVPILERSPVFKNVGFNAPSNRGRDNRETFSLKAELENPRSEGKQP